MNKILLVDDNNFFLETEKEFFRREEVVLLTAGNGREALEIIRAEQPGLVFTDLFMPEVNGDEVCQAVKRDPRLKTTTIIIVTSTDREADLNRCRQAGCDGVIIKPFKREQFLGFAQKFLRSTKWSGQRIRTKIPATFRASGGSPCTGSLLDLNTGGLFLGAESLLPIDAQLDLEFTLNPQSASIRCQGRVAWRNSAIMPRSPDLPPGMGIQFVHLEAGARRAIQRWMDQSV
jgi:CheY-like chemotaxis protein